MNRIVTPLLAIVSCLVAGQLHSQEIPAAEPPPGGLIASALGVTRQGTAIGCWLHGEDFDLHTAKTRILLVGGANGDARSTAAVRAAIRWFYSNPEAAAWRDRFVLSAVPDLCPDPSPSQPSSENARAGSASRGYPPPQDGFYNSPQAAEAAYFWRWVGMFAPDLVVHVRDGEQPAWFVPPAEHRNWQSLTERLSARQREWEPDELVWQLNHASPCETWSVPAIEAVVAGDEGERGLRGLLEAVAAASFSGPSPARRELQRRLDRSPQQVATELSAHYGQALAQVAYIPAVALIGRLRLGDLSSDVRHRTDVERIVAPYVQGDKPTKPDNGSALPGHLVFCELAGRSTGAERKRYVDLARAAADLAFDEQGQIRESMPFHLEMSDSLFMGGPILAHVGGLTGDQRYFDACVQHLRFMRKLCLRDDGLYRHSPLDETAWGRGNGFPALGVAWCLDKFPQQHAGREELLEWYKAHMQALLRHQDRTGCWHQVVDRPESYRELTSTCMIGYAMSLGIRNKWLEAARYQPVVERAWYAVKTRAPGNGRLVDVCTGTGKQKSLRAYYDRPAVLGPDDRGGAMALLFATEMMQSGGR